MRFSTTVSNTKAPANHFVAKASRASRDFDLFLDKKVSDLPLSADSPEFFPDWSTIMAISAMQIRSCIITNPIFTNSMLESILSKV